MNAVLSALHSMPGPWALLVLALVAFAETGVLVGFLIPGDSVMLSAGMLLAARILTAPVGVVLPVVALAAIAGDQVAFRLGARWGPRILSRPSSRWLNPRHLVHAQVFFARHGPKAVILARFVPLARTMTPVVAGAGRMPG